MATAAQMRKIVLALSGVEESAHMGHPDFRRRGKIFAGLARGETVANLRLTPEIQASVVHEGSPFEACAGAWGRSGWTQAELARVETSLLKELLREAWELVGSSVKASKEEGAPRKKKALAKKALAKEAPAKKVARARR